MIDGIGDLPDEAGQNPATRYAAGRRRFRLLVMASLILASCSLLFSAVLFTLNADRADEINRERAANAARIKVATASTRQLLCNIARLVAYVPAFQFEGESRANFVGWLEARRDMLTSVRVGGTCGAETLALLRERVRLDNELLQD